MKHDSKTEFAYPVKRICGKISRHSQVIHACTASGKQITYLQGERDFTKHPVSAEEAATRPLFSKRAKAAGARLKKTASTYETDLANFRAQLDTEGGLPTFSSYIWSIIKAEITE